VARLLLPRTRPRPAAAELVVAPAASLVRHRSRQPSRMCLIPSIAANQLFLRIF
jgi:hypothetical protein